MLVEARAEVHRPSSRTWGEVLSRIPHDIYHTAQYHLVPGLGTAGEPYAFSYEEERCAFLWPYFLVPIPQAPGYFDVTSAYGYPGPVGTPDPAFIERAWRALLYHWKQQHAVSAFTRFHPLLGNARLLDGVSSEDGKPAWEGLRELGLTVSIDLTQSLEQQVRGYNKKMRQSIRKLFEAGYECGEDHEFAHLDDFIRVYTATMSRRMSRAEFVVDADWVREFRCLLGENARLFVTKYQGAVVAAMLVMEYAPYVHCHLIGTDERFAAESPSKALLDYVRRWGTERGLRSMHLGGGVGGRQDSLFEYKSRFSEVTHGFQIGGWVLDEPVYRELETAHRARLEAMGVEADREFFPAYRSVPG
ncbi:MAG: GNAT family N-acetyltransferase [Acidobacteria bacterium]|nr:GNAT family N-acetyltransferase [Acidobacteriota bacterium]